MKLCPLWVSGQLGIIFLKIYLCAHMYVGIVDRAALKNKTQGSCPGLLSLIGYTKH